MTLPRPGYYLGNHRILTITDRGDRMYLDTRDMMITPGVLSWGSWEPETTKTFESILKPGMKWADVGANVGYFSVIGHRLVQGDGGETYCFEANPATYELLVDNMNLNWFWGGVRTEQKAVFTHETTLKFHAPVKFAVNASIGQNDVSHALDRNNSFYVETVSLDNYFHAKGIKLDFIKVDVEGAEEFVLKGASEMLRDNRDLRLLIEWSPSQMPGVGSSVEAMSSLLRDYEFKIEVAEGERRPVTIEDLQTITSTTMLLLER